MFEFSQLTNTVSHWFTGVTSFGNSTVTDTTVTESGEESLSNSQQDLGFDNWLSAALDDSSTENTEVLENFASRLEKGIFSALGLGGSNISIESLTSDSSLTKIQSSLLTALQTDLFSQATDSLSEESSTPKSLEDTAETASFLSSIYTVTMGKDGATLDDVFDAVNVLNHIPVVNDLYENVTDNHVDLAAGLIGGYLYAGPIGLAYEGLDYFVEQTTGQSMLQNVKSITLESWFSEESEIMTTVEEGVLDTGEKATYEFVSRNFN